MNITKAAHHGRYRTHASYEGHPLCGGGHGGKTAQWQLDMAFVNCRACLNILNPPPPTKPDEPAPCGSTFNNEPKDTNT